MTKARARPPASSLRPPAWTLLAFLLLAALACGAPEPDDSAEPLESEPEEQDIYTCDVPEIDVNGPSPPQVGDTWTVWLWCDDVLLTGVQRLSFDPPDFASIDANEATFLTAGSATMTLQVGSFIGTEDVTVEEAARR